MAQESSLFRLIYASEAEGLSKTDLAAILEVSETNNQRDNITGGLLLSTEKVLQVLEGARDLVTATYNRIAQDDRHKNVVILSAATTDRRIFRDWSMRFFGDTALNRDLILKFSTTDRFEPSRLSSECAVSLLQSLE